MAAQVDPLQRSFGGRAFTARWRDDGAREQVTVIRQDPYREVTWSLGRAAPPAPPPGTGGDAPVFERVRDRIEDLLHLRREPEPAARPRAPLSRVEFSELPGVVALLRADGSFEGRFFGACCYPHALAAMARDGGAGLPHPVHAELVRGRVGPAELDPEPRSAACVYHGDVQVALVCDRHLETGRWHRGQRRPAMESLEFIGRHRLAITYRDGSVRVRRYLRDAHRCLAGEPLALSDDGRHLVAWTVESDSVDAGWNHVADGVAFHVLDIDTGTTAARAWLGLAAGAAPGHVEVSGSWPALIARVRAGDAGGQALDLGVPPLHAGDGVTAYFCHEKTVRDARPGHERTDRRLRVHLHRSADMEDLGRREATVPADEPRGAITGVRLEGAEPHRWLEVEREGGTRHRHSLAAAP